MRHRRVKGNMVSGRISQPSPQILYQMQHFILDHLPVTARIKLKQTQILLQKEHTPVKFVQLCIGKFYGYNGLQVKRKQLVVPWVPP